MRKVQETAQVSSLDSDNNLPAQIERLQVEENFMALKEFLQWQTGKSIDEQIDFLQRDYVTIQSENDTTCKTVY